MCLEMTAQKKNIYVDIAQSANVKLKTVMIVLTACRDVIATRIANGSNAKIHVLCNFKVKAVKAKASQIRKCFGKEIRVKARLAGKTLKIIPTKQLKDMINA